MKTNVYKMYKALRFMREFLDKKEVPAYWLEFIILVHMAGPQGINTKEVASELGMTQGIASRLVKIMSLYHDRESESQLGFNILGAIPDMEFRHRQQVYLTKKGEELMKGIEKILE